MSQIKKIEEKRDKYKKELDKVKYDLSREIRRQIMVYTWVGAPVLITLFLYIHTMLLGS